MPIDLNGGWTKFQRANVHLSALDKAIRSFLDSGTHEIQPQLNKQTGEVVIYVEPHREPPILEWNAILGDIVHNLRSALDHLVWALTLDAGHIPPAVVRGTDWRKIRFPIYIEPFPVDEAGNFISWSTQPPQSLWGVRPSLHADLQSLQPFNHGQSAPKQPLAVLEELWNIDKHRHLLLTNYLVGLEDVSTLPDSGAPEVEFRILEKRTPGPLKGRTEVGRAESIRERKSDLLEMHVNPTVSFNIAFEKGPPAYGDLVTSTLWRLRDCVVDILVGFNTVWRGPHG